MLDKLFFSFNAILPIILIILLGYVVKRIKLLPENFFPLLNRLCFYVCLPILLFYNIYNVNNITEIVQNWKIVLFAILSIFVIFFLGLGFVTLWIKDNAQKGVVLQCIFRSNYVILGIPLATTLAAGNSVSLAISSVLSAVVVPLFNVLAILALSIFGKKEKLSVKNIIKKIITNPLIISVFVGIFALGFRALLPSSAAGIKVFTIKNNLPFLYSSIEKIANIASPIALIALGGNFTFSAIPKLKIQIFSATFIRLICVPSIFLGIAYFLDFNSNEFPALIALFATSVAVSSVPMCEGIGGDTQLAGQLVVWTTVFSAITLFLIIFICTHIGIFV
ncbi:MAG: AEC family transporter [Spirochaetaceae bacterium]|nr:AEC family transporter [Spirochaetaceae bacterium]